MTRLKHRGDEPHLLREIFRTYHALLSGFSSATGMPASRFMLMRLLAFSDEGVGVNELARRLEINPAAVSRQVKELEGERLVKRRPDARDGRRSTVTLSATGRKQFDRIHERSHELERLISTELGETDIQQTATVLAKLRTFLEELRSSRIFL